jgi:hypothetical protein
MGDKNGFELSQAQKRDHEDGRRRAPPKRRVIMRACTAHPSSSDRTSTYPKVGAECKRHKIKCEPVANGDKCAKCTRSGTECVPYNLNQRFMEEDAS